MRRLSSRRGCLDPSFAIPPPPTWDGNLGDLLSFILQVLFWFGEAILAFLVDVFGALFIGLACLVYAALSAPVMFLYAIFQGSVGSYRQFGPLAPVVGALVFGGVIVILAFFILLVYRLVISQSEEDITGNEEGPGAGEVGEIAEEL